MRPRVGAFRRRGHNGLGATLLHREGYKIMLPDGSIEVRARDARQVHSMRARLTTRTACARAAAAQEDSLAGDVQIQRVKFHYFERYVYGMAQTPDALEVARRASTWLFLYMWRRGLFEVQYAGIITLGPLS